MSQISETLDAAAESFSDALKRQLEACRDMVVEREGEGEYRVFFAEPPNNVFLRLYGVEGERHHAVFAAVVGFVPGEPTFQLYVGEPELRDGTDAISGIEATTVEP